MDGLSYRKAELADLSAIIELYRDDKLGAKREDPGTELNPRYTAAWEGISADPNHYLMVVEKDGEIAATCHLTLMPSLTMRGAMRLQIEAVRVAKELRGQRIGDWMIRQALQWGRVHGASIAQLSTHKDRLDAKRFYERLGFVASHHGMKIDLV